MNGRALCQLTRDEFNDRTGHFLGGDILFEHLDILQQEAEQKTLPKNTQPLDYSPVSTTGNTVVLPLYPSEQYQPPSHIYPSYQHQQQQQQHHLYAGEQYHHYGFQHCPPAQYPSIPPPAMPYFRNCYTVRID